MIEEKSPKKGYKILLIILCALILGVASFWIYDVTSELNDIKIEKSALENQVRELQSENKSLKAEADETKSGDESNSTNNSATTSTCTSTLTKDDKSMSEDWKTYKNTTYKYSFKYPKSWTISEQMNHGVTITDNVTQLTFGFLSGPAAIIGTVGYDLDKKQDVKVACQSAVRSSYNGVEMGGEDSRIISTSFTKGGTKHMINMFYTDRGASISGDIIDAYNVILKTVSFTS